MKSRSFTKLHSWLKVTLSSKQPINDMYKSRRWKHCALKGIMLVVLSYEKVLQDSHAIAAGLSWTFDATVKFYIWPLMFGLKIRGTNKCRLVFFYFCSFFFLPSLFCLRRLCVTWSKTVSRACAERLRGTLCADMTVLSILVFLKKWNGHFFFIVPLTGLNRTLNLSVKSVPYSAKWFAV